MRIICIRVMSSVTAWVEDPDRGVLPLRHPTALGHRDAGRRGAANTRPHQREATMGSRRIRVSSRALGDLRLCIVHVYDTADEMRAAGTRFNHNDLTGYVGLTQSYHDVSTDRTAVPVVRLTRSRLGIRVISHEMHHAATAIYGSTQPDDVLSSAILTHHNEPFAYLYSDLLAHLVVSLYRFGYYE